MGLLAYVDRSPSPFHAVECTADMLSAAGYVRLDERAPWPNEPGRYMVARAGSLIAWDTRSAPAGVRAFRVIGGHTDSPNLRLKQEHDLGFRGIDSVALEPYGGPLLESWLDRDLAVAGRVVLRDGSEHLVHVDEPVLTVPRLAIHLDRDGSTLDRQTHLNAVWSRGGGHFLEWLLGHIGQPADAVLGFDLMTAPTQPSALTGAAGEYVAAPRLDNQATCFAGTRALLRADPPEGTVPVLALFDHEEVGSTSERGAQSPFLSSTLERIVGSRGGDRESLWRAIAASVCASGDMAHATHPNHVGKHEPLHQVSLGGGPVLKVNQNLRYATDGRGAAVFAVACEQAAVPLQRYVHRADLPCGSTIGPLSAARTGMLTVDVGAPQLAMHSARELMAAADVELYVAALAAFASPRA